MKKESKLEKKELFKSMTPEQAATVNGGRRGRGADDDPGHVRGGGDDGPNHT